jgi:hypothetical protein
MLSEAEINLTKNIAKKTSRVERDEDNFQTGLPEQEQPHYAASIQRSLKKLPQELKNFIF